MIAKEMILGAIILSASAYTGATVEYEREGDASVSVFIDGEKRWLATLVWENDATDFISDYSTADWAKPIMKRALAMSDLCDN